ncbi:MAG TPA: flavin reductase [Clostridia bacterium]|nr:flavin reductase [Clostridia bacterium]
MLALEQSRAYLEQLTKGSFLICKNKGKVNLMTIGWGSMGYLWNRFIVMVPIRTSRYSYEMLKEEHFFTISVPRKGQFSRELQYCGTKSGRDVDKVKELSLVLEEGTIPVPHLKGAHFHLECKILYKEEIDPKNLDGQVDLECYPNKDYSVLFYAEIVNIIE